VKHACIVSHRGEFKVRLMCRVLSVSVSGFYAFLRRSPSEHLRKDRSLVGEIRSVHEESRKRYGSPRVHEELKTRGVRVGRKRVARLMRESGMRAKTSPAFRVTTDSAHHHSVGPNLLNRRFTPSEIGSVNRAWASDITFIPTREGWLYLSVVIDLASRRVVGWSMQRTLQRSIALDAMRMALSFRRPAVGMIHHSDRGMQYACAEYRALLKAHSIECSMSRSGRLLGQRGHGEFLCHAQEGAGSRLTLGDQNRGKGSGIRVHRDVVQSASSPLLDRISIPRRLRRENLGDRSLTQCVHQIGSTPLSS
jgi:putative transposase